jgi:hypothetical protein
MSFFIAVLMAGLVYLWHEGALDWNKKLTKKKTSSAGAN